MACLTFRYSSPTVFPKTTAQEIVVAKDYTATTSNEKKKGLDRASPKMQKLKEQQQLLLRCCVVLLSEERKGWA